MRSPLSFRNLPGWEHGDPFPVVELAVYFINAFDKSFILDKFQDFMDFFQVDGAVKPQSIGDFVIGRIVVCILYIENTDEQLLVFGVDQLDWMLFSQEMRAILDDMI